MKGVPATTCSPASSTCQGYNSAAVDTTCQPRSRCTVLPVRCGDSPQRCAVPAVGRKKGPLVGFNRKLLVYFLAACLLLFCLGQLLAAEPVTARVNLLEVIRSGEVDYFLNPKADVHDKPADIWSFSSDGSLRISGRGYGYVATRQSYRDYHLVIEFKWGDKTWGKREQAARDNGILLHAYGPHGAYNETWMASIEAQIIEGGTGDILVLSPQLADGTMLTTSLESEYALDRDQEKIWKQGSPRQTVTRGRINWKGRDEDWADKRGFRGRHDVESPCGQWTRLEVIARGKSLQYFVNGVQVNEAFNCQPNEGRILLQTEAAEMFVRRFELHPLDQFQP